MSLIDSSVTANFGSRREAARADHSWRRADHDHAQADEPEARSAAGDLVHLQPGERGEPDPGRETTASSRDVRSVTCPGLVRDEAPLSGLPAVLALAGFDFASAFCLLAVVSGIIGTFGISFSACEGRVGESSRGPPSSRGLVPHRDWTTSMECKRSAGPAPPSELPRVERLGRSPPDRVTIGRTSKEDDRTTARLSGPRGAPQAQYAAASQGWTSRSTMTWDAMTGLRLCPPTWKA